MRRFSCCLFAFAVSVLSAAVADAQTGATLSGKMASFNYLFGPAWSCTVSVPAMGGQPAQTVQSTVTFDAVPGNVLHVHVVDKMSNGDQYFGYSTQRNMYWSASANSMGMSAMQMSADGKTYAGSAPMGASSASIRDTYTKISDTHVTFHEVVTINGKDEVTDGSCTR